MPGSFLMLQWVPLDGGLTWVHLSQWASWWTWLYSDTKWVRACGPCPIRLLLRLNVVSFHEGISTGFPFLPCYIQCNVQNNWSTGRLWVSTHTSLVCVKHPIQMNCVQIILFPYNIGDAFWLVFSFFGLTCFLMQNESGKLRGKVLRNPGIKANCIFKNAKLYI